MDLFDRKSLASEEPHEECLLFEGFPVHVTESRPPLSRYEENTSCLDSEGGNKDSVDFLPQRVGKNAEYSLLYDSNQETMTFDVGKPVAKVTLVEPSSC